MKYIQVTKENIEQEHVCCAISSNDDCQVRAKKHWLMERFSDGLVFLKGDVRGKFFIEYLPAEKAWIPLEAENYMYIDCLWIAGQFKGHGYSNDLLNKCIVDAKEKGKQGLCILSSLKQKKPFLADPKYLLHKGFRIADMADPYFTLMYLPFLETALVPKFRPCVKSPQVENGFVLYFADQCPYTAKYVPLLQKVAENHSINMTVRQFETTEDAQNGPTPFTSFSLFYKGKFVTHEILSEQRFSKIIDELIA